MRRNLAMVGLLALLAIVAGCGQSNDTTVESIQSDDESTAVERSDDVAGRTKPEVSVSRGAPSGRLETKDLIEGTGAKVESGDKVTVQYVGFGYKSRREFDSSWSRNEPFRFTLGASEVVPGWDDGIEGMSVGGRRELIIPPELGYGEAGTPVAVGPNDTLIFVIDLVEVE